MSEPWDDAPAPATPPPQSLVFSHGRSPEEVAAINQKLREQANKASEQECKEAAAAWPQQRVEMVQERLKLLRLYQKTPGAERGCLRDAGGRRLLDAEGCSIRLRTCVYLMRCPSITSAVQTSLFDPGISGSVYKIGHTRNLRNRTGKHQRKLEDPLIEHHTIYYTPCPRRILEWFLLRHFHNFRVRPDLSKELFDLPQEEVDGFGAVAKAIEQHLLAVEVLWLKALLSRYKAACP